MRKVEIVRAPANFGRDAGKHFMISEWPAERAETWGIEALLAFNRGSGPLPAIGDLLGTGMEGIFYVGVQTFLRGHMRADEVVPIMAQLMECVRMVRDPKAVDVATGQPVATPIADTEDIAEVRTRLWLRSEVLRVHTGFSAADAVSTFLSAMMAAAPKDTPTT